MSQPLWDIPTRCFHWAVVALLPVCWWSAENQKFEVHLWAGCTVLVLVVVRILWGFCGSRHSRFSDFLVGPRKVLAYVRGAGAGAQSAGHNPLGGWSVMVLLTLLLLQAVSGLFNSDDIFYSAPLYYGAPDTLRNVMGEIHDVCFNLLLAFVALHISAVLYHQLRHKEKLVQAMLFGRAAGREGRESPKRWWWALLLVIAVALLLWWGLEQAPQPAPAPWLNSDFQSF